MLLNFANEFIIILFWLIYGPYFGHLLFEHHVQHAFGAVGFQQFDNVRMLQHVAYCCLAFQIWNAQTNRNSHEIEIGFRRKITGKREAEWFLGNLPAVLSPGLAVNFATSTIFTANCNFDSRCMHRRTIEKGPLRIHKEKKDGWMVISSHFDCYPRWRMCLGIKTHK